MHESIREYARLRLQDAGEDDVVAERCFLHYVSRCQRFAVEGRYRLLAWLPWIELEIDNVRALLRRCLDRGDVERGTDLATWLIWYWVTRGTTEGVRWLDELLARVAEPAAHPWAYFVRGFLAVQQSDPAAADPVLERGIAAARAGGQLEVLSQSLSMASIAAAMAGDHAASARLLDDARTVADGLDALGATLMVLQARALNGLVEGDPAAVVVAASEGARLSREAGDVYSLGMMLMNQGFAALASGDPAESEQRFAEGLRLARELDDRLAQCYLLGGLACCAAVGREPRLAAQLLGAMESLRAEVGGSINAGMASAFSRAAASAEAALGTSRFRSEHASGRRLGRDAAARLALREAAPAVDAGAAQDTDGVLGRREVEVARLVADGLTNKEIGSHLFISERTVESHVRNILNKLGVNTRAQIAGWMASSGS
jgi:DNA-binding NarL/FixJ family response regulator